MDGLSRSGDIPLRCILYTLFEVRASKVLKSGSQSGGGGRRPKINCPDTTQQIILLQKTARMGGWAWMGGDLLSYFCLFLFSTHSRNDE